jgi:hypothetical protein
MEEWLKKLLGALNTKSLPQSPDMGPGGTPYFNPRRGDGLPGAEQIQTPIKNGIPAVQATIPINSNTAPPLTPPPNQVPTAPVQTTSGNVEDQYNKALGEFNTVLGQSPKLPHKMKNNIMQGLFLGLQGIQRIADPEHAPQGPIMGLGQARKNDKLAQIGARVQGLGAEVESRAKQRKVDLESRKTQTEIDKINYDIDAKEYERLHPGMEIQKGDDGSIYERPKGSGPGVEWKPAKGITQPQRVAVTLRDGTKVMTTGDKAIDREIASDYRQAQMDMEAGKFNAGALNDYEKELTKWSADNDKLIQEQKKLRADGQEKQAAAQELLRQAAALESQGGVKEASDLRAKAIEMNAEGKSLERQGDGIQLLSKPKPPRHTLSSPKLEKKRSSVDRLGILD